MLRLFSDTYDSIRLHGFNWNDSADKATLLARLRLDALLHHLVVIEDDSFFDHAFFLASVPSDLPLRSIEVMRRKGSLEESFVAGLVREGEVRPYYFDTLQTPIAMHVQAELLRFSPAQLNSYAKIAEALVAIGVDRAIVAQMELGWARWIEAEKNGRLKTISWKKERIDRRPWLARDRHDLERHLSDAGKRLAQSVGDAPARSDAYGEIERFLIANPSLTTDAATVRSWYDDGHTRARILQHECTVLDRTDFPGCAPFTEARRLTDQAVARADAPDSEFEAQVPTSFLAALGGLSAREFEEVTRVATESSLELWLKRYDATSLRRVLRAVVREVDTRHRFEDHSALFRSVHGASQAFIKRTELPEPIETLVSLIPGASAVVAVLKIVRSSVEIAANPANKGKVVQVSDALTSAYRRRFEEAHIMLRS